MLMDTEARLPAKLCSNRRLMVGLDPYIHMFYLIFHSLNLVT